MGFTTVLIVFSTWMIVLNSTGAVWFLVAPILLALFPSQSLLAKAEKFSTAVCATIVTINRYIHRLSIH